MEAIYEGRMVAKEKKERKRERERERERTRRTNKHSPKAKSSFFTSPRYLKDLFGGRLPLALGLWERFPHRSKEAA
ncbi:hypothetical protein IE53DRAFT_232382 [Violaceomyces palustris]|uniref:Uncharacterized protein n=1 Tax=Violaceomyces palustris TaxID=1673888 RepID=A0ACD0NPI5_9BASI|nr:hypothetical protein IE53DRAFT_232382 [Violaceomyces palustris]